MKLRLVFAFLLLAGVRLQAEPKQTTLSVAAAANFVAVVGELDHAFAQTEPGITVTTAIGSSGSLFAQIRNGAPYDVFLSADLDFPRRLARAGAADPASLTPFANGRLALWTTRPGIPVVSIAATVTNPDVHKLAVANPLTAPYGLAAQQALERLGLAAVAAPKIVTGENIGQTAAFVETGNADAGFVALSLVLSPKLKDRGRWLEVPQALYDPLRHAAILTLRGSGNPAARRYLIFLRSPEARRILERFGYGIP